MNKVEELLRMILDINLWMQAHTCALDICKNMHTHPHSINQKWKNIYDGVLFFCWVDLTPSCRSMLPSKTTVDDKSIKHTYIMVDSSCALLHNSM